MPEKEADDDDSFGDFAFVSTSNNNTSSSLFISSQRNSNIDDDDWGDFMESPLHFQFNNNSNFFNNQNPPNHPSGNHFFPAAVSDPALKVPDSGGKSLLFQASNGFLHQHQNSPYSLSHSAGDQNFSDLFNFFTQPISQKSPESSENLIPFKGNNGFLDHHQSPTNFWPDFPGNHDLSDQDRIFQSPGSVRAEKTENAPHFPAGNGFIDQNSCTQPGRNHDFSDPFQDFQAPSFDFPESKPTHLEIKWEKPLGALPLSIFGDSEADSNVLARNSDDIFDARDGFSFTPVSPAKNGVIGTTDRGSKIALDDLIASLYSQAEQTSANNSPQKPAQEGSDTAQLSLNSDLIRSAIEEDGDFDENGWEFKDASSETRAEDRDSESSMEGNPQNSSPNEKLNDFVGLLSGLKEGSDPVQLTSSSDFLSSAVNEDQGFEEIGWEFKDVFSETRSEYHGSGFMIEGAPQNSPCDEKVKDFVGLYCRLKEASQFFALRHLDELEKSRKIAVTSGDDAKAMALSEEIQGALAKLQKENEASNGDSGYHPPRNLDIGAFLEALHEPRFQSFDLEYHLSKRISSAKEELSSAIGLFEHAVLVLCIMTLASLEDQSSYIRAWSKMISACAKELQHGVMIWRESLQKNVHTSILSEPRGLKYFIALGEIYRVVEVLGTSAEVYKPWLLSNSLESVNIFNSLKDCAILWTESGIKEALESILDPSGLQYEEKINKLMESIISIRGLDSAALQNDVLDQTKLTCRLSLLPLGMLKGMKAVIWNEEHYFLALANLWVNRISCDTPGLPLMHVG